jgi:hypothetical protein
MATKTPAPPTPASPADPPRPKVGDAVAFLTDSGRLVEAALVYGVMPAPDGGPPLLHLQHADDFGDPVSSPRVEFGPGERRCWATTAEDHRRARREPPDARGRGDARRIPQKGERIVYLEDIGDAAYEQIRPVPGKVSAVHSATRIDITFQGDHGQSGSFDITHGNCPRAWLYESEAAAIDTTRRRRVEVEAVRRNLRCGRCRGVIPMGSIGTPFSLPPMPGHRAAEAVNLFVCDDCIRSAHEWARAGEPAAQSA